MIKIDCGVQHSASIDSNNELFVWGKFGNQTFPIPTKIRMNTSVMTVSCGEQHTLVLDTECSVFSWGNNNYGQLGLGDLRSRE